MKYSKISLQCKIRFLMQQFIGRVGIVMFGTVVGQGIAFICLPFISRFFQANVIGNAAIILALINIFSMINSFQYDQAIIVSSDQDLIGVMKLSLLINTGINFILLLFVLFIPILCNRSVVEGIQSAGFHWLLPLMSYAYSIFMILINYHLRKNDLFVVSLGRIIYYGGGAIAQVLFGLIIGGSEEVYLIAQFAACLIAVVIILPKKFILNMNNDKEYKLNILVLARKYRNFPKFQLGAALINSIAAQFPIFFMRIAFSDSWAGYFYMAWRILAAPVTIISQAFGQIFFRDSAEIERKGRPSGIYVEKTVINLVRISFLPALIVGVLAQYMVDIFLGIEWTQVGIIIRYLLIGIIITFVVSPLSSFLTVKNKQEKALILNLLLFFLKVMGLFIGYLLSNALNAILLFSIGTFIGMVIFFLEIIREADSTVNNIAKQIHILIIGGTIIIFSLILLDQFTMINKYLINTIAILFLIILGIFEFMEGIKHEIISN